MRDQITVGSEGSLSRVRRWRGRRERGEEDVVRRRVMVEEEEPAMRREVGGVENDEGRGVEVVVEASENEGELVSNLQN